MDGVKGCLSDRGLTIPEAKECGKDRREWRRIVGGDVVTGLPLSLKTEISKLAKENCEISKNSNRVYQKKQKIAKLLFSYIHSYYVV